MFQNNRLFLLVAALVTLLCASCAFEGLELERRQCSRTPECVNAFGEGFICTDGFCQEGVEDVGVDIEDEPPPTPTCVDDDNDGFFDITFDCPENPELVQDCNDEDPNINPDATEVCNGTDDDCDDNIDDADDSYVPEPCDSPVDGVELTGVCAGAVKACESGLTVACTDAFFQEYATNNGKTYVRNERSCDNRTPDGFCEDAYNTAFCDGEDNDCDGVVDEDDLTIDCYTGNRSDLTHGAAAICQRGQLTCTNGRYENSLGEATEDCAQSDQILPGSELEPDTRCNNRDDDCDGFVDSVGDGNPSCLCTADRLCTPPGAIALESACEVLEDIDISNLDDAARDVERARACNGICQAGIQRCVDGVFQECEFAVLPGVESCDNPQEDNDCNSVVDDIPITFTTQPVDGNGDPTGDPIETNVRVTPQAHGDTPVAQQGETCSFTVQEDIAQRIEGVCQEVTCPPNDPDCVERTSVYQCEAGEVVCRPISEPQDELCGNVLVDDNCDGRLDDLLFTQANGSSTLRVFGDLIETDQCPIDENQGSVPLFNPTTNPDLNAENCCDTGLQGLCQFGRWSCNTPELPAQCLPVIDPETEPDNECDGFDQNCNGFVDEGNDRNSQQHCGECNNACSGNANTCCFNDNIAAPTNPDDPTQFSCVDTTSDVNNCGNCGTRCEGSVNTCCPNENGEGACVDTDNDPNNCGGCGVACGDNQACCGGQCEDINVATRCGRCDIDCSNGGIDTESVCCDNLVCAPNAASCL